MIMARMRHPDIDDAANFQHAIHALRDVLEVGDMLKDMRGQDFIDTGIRPWPFLLEISDDIRLAGNRVIDVDVASRLIIPAADIQLSNLLASQLR